MDRTLTVTLACLGVWGCTASEPVTLVPSFSVTVTKVNGAAPPAEDKPLPANRGDVEDQWDFSIEAQKPTGGFDAAFDGVVRLSVKPGTVMRVDGDGASGRNIRVTGGKATGSAFVTAVYGPTRLWVDDLGYVPAPVGKTAKCSNGRDDDGDVLIDYPADPGCAYADDDNEAGGTFAAGVSTPVYYALPRVVDVQGESAQTPYPYEGIEVKTSAPQQLVVTRVSSDGFYVTDLADQATGYNHLFAFNFSTPSGMAVCDIATYLAGTVNEFFGYTELNFPSYRLHFTVIADKNGKIVTNDCGVPEPALIDDALIIDPIAMEKLEAGLVRIQNFRIGKNFGQCRPGIHCQGVPDANGFGPDRSNCDLNLDGQIDFSNPAEAQCADACAADVECSEWTQYSARGNYKVTDGVRMMQINTTTVAGFDPPGHKGESLPAVTGTLRNFSGGSLNWTIETRCPDDLVCAEAPCASAVKPSKEACVRPHTFDDTEGSN